MTGTPKEESTKLARSRMMSRIRAKNTKPELAIRRAIHALGYRFRLHRKDLPGKPDIVMARHQLVIFVHGCFWHQHHGCKLASKPKSATDYWGPKLARNVARDAEASAALRLAGWQVETVWECDTRVPTRLQARLEEIFPEQLARK
ncbi:MAG TPA: DNA mismatch endonuclease Vsr [Aurantimonas coralicida]|uniref:Very short patch repair endonuclease n=1 Tax=Aurantimonas coralicida TaxID=182270 RepID=A0A9C9NIE9_9HYPH|nr:DNA mismatch endonuclease Vsr [Aurantimonas coralicida]HEU01948.1 DNA mismatch endonuclease Vsr [Aurantimonas coralicida]